jgi:hypothetical protein
MHEGRAGYIRQEIALPFFPAPSLPPLDLSKVCLMHAGFIDFSSRAQEQAWSSCQNLWYPGS